MLLKELESGAIYRLLDEVASSETKDNATTHVVLIDITDDLAIPLFHGKLKMLEQIADRKFIVVEETREAINLNNLSDAEKRRVERRWLLTEMLVKHGAQLYDPVYRGAEALKLARDKKASKPFFYTTLRLFWQRGGGKASLITKYPNCGRPGQRRIAPEGAPKTGRPRTIQPGIGVAATEAHRNNMRVGWSRSPVGRDGRGLRGAYSWMLITRYSEHIRITPGKTQEVEIENYNAVPTFEQFEYHWKAEHSFEIRQLNRLQKRKFDLAFKMLLTGTLQEVRGPGTRYYIDATVLDVYCVSRLNRNRIVGRPTLYIVVDQFSRMIVGMYVGLEPPCWVGAMLALWNCCIDKVAFCAQYDIEITDAQWPTGHMPVHLMGDRGEWVSGQADPLSAGFNIDAENAPPYKGEAKGVGERGFNTLQTKFGLYMPGYVDKEFSGRDAEPAALKSALDIRQITRIMIHAVLYTNLRVVRDYEGWPEVIAAGVPFVPVSLWVWGEENLRCDSRKFDPAYLKKYLWPQGSMTFSRKGLQFYRGLYYMGVELKSQPWFAKSYIENVKLETAYHPLHIGSAVVFPAEQRTGAYDVELTRRSQRFGDVALCEVTALENQRKRTDAKAKWTNLAWQTSSEGQIHKTVKEGRKMTADQFDPSLSKRGRLKDIRSNRSDEIDLQTSEALTGTLGVDLTGRTAALVLISKQT